MKEMKAKEFGAPEEFWNENISFCKRCGEPQGILNITVYGLIK